MLWRMSVRNSIRQKSCVSSKFLVLPRNVPVAPGWGDCMLSWGSSCGEHTQPAMCMWWLTTAQHAQAAHAMEEGAGGFMRWLGKHAREMGRDIGLVLRIPTFNIVVLQARHWPAPRRQ